MLTTQHGFCIFLYLEDNLYNLLHVKYRNVNHKNEISAEDDVKVFENVTFSRMRSNWGGVFSIQSTI